MEANLTNEERGILTMLLEKEEKNLLIEISHCVLHDSRNALKSRLQLVTVLLDKFKMGDTVSAVYDYL